jgi:four helix bundle protein
VSIAIGSLTETEYLLSFSQRLGYLSKKDYTEVEALRSAVGKLLWSFYKTVSKSAIKPAS